MTEGLDVIIVDDEPAVCDAVSEIVRSFYSWGEVHAFTDFDEAISFCLKRQTGVAIFILDVFMGERTGFVFLDEIEERFPMAHEDAIIMTVYNFNLAPYQARFQQLKLAYNEKWGQNLILI